MPRLRRPQPFETTRTWPWHAPDFSRRALAVQLDPGTDQGTRRPAIIECEVEYLVAAAGLTPGDTVLDLACGPGLYAHAFARRGVDATGVDISPAAIEYARRVAAAESLPCEFLHADMRSVDLGRAFDLVMLIYGELNAMPPAEAAHLLARIAAHTKPGGRVAIEIAAPDAPHVRRAERHALAVCRRGIWSDGAYIEWRRTFHYADRNVTGLRFLVLSLPLLRCHAYDSFIQHYAPNVFEDMLRAAGLEPIACTGTLAGAPVTPRDEWRTWLARRH
jgi:SAM-dependent methyltransferase